MSDKKKVALIGTGMDGSHTLTADASKYIEKAQVLIGSSRMLRQVNPGEREVFCSYQKEEIRAFILSSNKERFAVLFSGDTGFYSAASGLWPLLTDCEVILIPGIPSISYFSSRIGVSWEDAVLLSLHGKEGNLALLTAKNPKLFCLAGRDPSELCRHLAEFGLSDVTVTIGENLGLPDEHITAGRPSELVGKTFSPLSVLCIENPHAGDEVMLGLSEESLVRGHVPVTKEEVRAVTLAKLHLKKDSCVFDIGAGTGSVSVEAAWIADRGTVFAVEKNPEAAELLFANRQKFCTDNIRIVEGSAPAALQGLPSPDAVFIGGSGGHLTEILDDLFTRYSGFHLVLNLITLEGVSEAVRYFHERTELSCDWEIAQVFTARGRQAGTMHLMMGQNPVTIISGWFGAGKEAEDGKTDIAHRDEERLR
ncbi:precorrin-6y C5,15-methyltransferase (decarboxylating) subunit CbiE [Anaerolentibacter hominis]|uniref:precorrin-6y C5,15-methyltransferase (decarboxylating) subunit CbiE n=1 Tax=Anaerolentibacter hominis TaxID=3079009 RepID=UPI0031B81A97